MIRRFDESVIIDSEITTKRFVLKLNDHRIEIPLSKLQELMDMINIY